jgi:hypothetical protein
MRASAVHEIGVSSTGTPFPRPQTNSGEGTLQPPEPDRVTGLPEALAGCTREHGRAHPADKSKATAKEFDDVKLRESRPREAIERFAGAH